MIKACVKTLILLLCVCCSECLFSQNLVPNGDFEANDYGQVRDWKQPIEDYYHYEARSTATDSGLIYNSINGLCLLHPSPSEFLIARLKTPLEKGRQYCFSMNMFKGGCFVGKFEYLNSIEIAFSDTPIQVWKRRKLYLQPRVSLPVKMEGSELTQPDRIQFTADGTEQYIVIGKFHTHNPAVSFEEKRNAIWREQYYAADSIKKYFLTLLPPTKPIYSKRDIKRETRRLKDSLDKLEMAKIDALHANASFYQDKVAHLTHYVDTSNYHVRIYMDNICLAPVQQDGSCVCTETEKKPFEIGQTYRLNNIQFDLDKATFKPQSYAEMDNLVRVLHYYPGMVIRLNGHTDSLNTDAYNLDLSNRRAKAVYQYLISKGIPAKRLSWKGFGESKPITANTTEEGRAVNRRVEFLVLKVE